MGHDQSGRQYNNAGTIFELYPDRYVAHEWHYLVAYNSSEQQEQGLLTEDPSARRLWHDERWR